MSKAFTREDDADESPAPVRQWPKVPPGAKNYVTGSGARALRAELDQLLQQERPTLAALATNDSRRELQLLDQRILHLQQSLESAVIVEPTPPPWNQVRFGATVRVRDGHGEESTYRIVGVDEADLDRDWISWCSPLARALVNSQPGQRIRFRVPAGQQELEIVEIIYD
jgi:transcription elongation factor GreB